MIKYLSDNRWPVLTLLFLLSFLIYITSIPPSGILSVVFFFMLLFFFLLSFTFIFSNKLKINLMIVFYVLLLALTFFLNLGNLVNIFLLTAVFATFFFMAR